ncbi:hypothetical protein [Flavobacterium selenitireducens]|uniref:hypothetical protein n=1 Tax=Flavobacterium selenitireducens TaxID=2722704 RepID=UPI00168C0AA4|nr:hypothetical protein [Flavobacterium selenitireducens]MBD3581997.1 hypothetical protein [Flavobacterium selenitireducens]
MRFEIPFDPEHYRQKSAVLFDVLWEKGRKARIKLGIASVVLGAFGSFAIIGNSDLGYIFVCISAILGIVVWRNYYFQRRSRKEMDTIIDRTLSKQTAEKTIVEFTADFYSAENADEHYKLAWKSFRSYREIRQTLYIFGDTSLSFAISETELGTEDYQKVRFLISSVLPDSSLWKTM